MNKEKHIDDMDLAVLNCYRNKYYTDGNSTEQGIIANAINDILPILVSLKNGDYRKQSEGEWENVYNHDTTDGHLQRKTACSICGYKPKGENKTKYCPNCGAHMKGGAE